MPPHPQLNATSLVTTDRTPHRVSVELVFRRSSITGSTVVTLTLNGAKSSATRLNTRSIVASSDALKFAVSVSVLYAGESIVVTPYELFHEVPVVVWPLKSR